MLGRDRLDMAVRYAASLLAFAFDGAPRPFSAAFNVTDRCNLQCEYCNFTSFAGPELTGPEVGVLFDRLRAMGIRRLGIVGGEPLVRPDIGEILRRARARGFFVTVSSNLVLHHRRPGALASAHVVFTSLDGDRATHEAQRGAGSYAGVLEAVRALVAAGTPVVAICVVRRGDVDAARALLAQARADGFRMHFQPQCLDAPITRGALPDDADDASLRAYWAALARMKQDGAPIASSLAYLRAQGRWPDARVSAVRDPRVRCAAGRGFLFVDPRGRASPCTFTRGRGPTVDLLTEDWRIAWNRETACTRCNVGPMLEFNLLFRHPLRAALNGVRNYG